MKGSSMWNMAPFHSYFGCKLNCRLKFYAQPSYVVEDQSTWKMYDESDAGTDILLDSVEVELFFIVANYLLIDIKK